MLQVKRPGSEKKAKTNQRGSEKEKRKPFTPAEKHPVPE